jgi:hypothetical protein
MKHFSLTEIKQPKSDMHMFEALISTGQHNGAIHIYNGSHTEATTIALAVCKTLNKLELPDDL